MRRESLAHFANKASPHQQGLEDVSSYDEEATAGRIARVALGLRHHFPGVVPRTSESS